MSNLSAPVIVIVTMNFDIMLFVVTWLVYCYQIRKRLAVRIIFLWRWYFETGLLRLHTKYVYIWSTWVCKRTPTDFVNLLNTWIMRWEHTSGTKRINPKTKSIKNAKAILCKQKIRNQTFKTILLIGRFTEPKHMLGSCHLGHSWWVFPSILPV